MTKTLQKLYILKHPKCRYCMHSKKTPCNSDRCMITGKLVDSWQKVRAKLCKNYQVKKDYDICESEESNI